MARFAPLIVTTDAPVEARFCTVIKDMKMSLIVKDTVRLWSFIPTESPTFLV